MATPALPVLQQGPGLSHCVVIQKYAWRLASGKLYYKHSCMKTIPLLGFAPGALARNVHFLRQQSTRPKPVRWSLWNVTRYLALHVAIPVSSEEMPNTKGSLKQRLMPGEFSGLSREEYVNAPKWPRGLPDLPATVVTRMEVGDMNTWDEIKLLSTTLFPSSSQWREKQEFAIQIGVLRNVSKVY